MNLIKFIMKSRILFRTVLASFVILFSTLACFGQDDPADQVVGNWIKSSNMGSVAFTISADQKWEVEFTGDGKADVFGTYAISGNQITFTDKGGDYSSESDGVYDFTVSDSLRFAKVNDLVDGRSRLVIGSWGRAAETDK